MFVSKEIAKTRYQFCKECDHFTAVKVCAKCSCFMPAKVVLSLSKCPINKWGSGKVDNSITEQFNVEE